MDGQTAAVSFIRNTRWDELPDPVQRKLKLCLVDMGAAIVSGALTPASEITASYAAEVWTGEDATILLHGSRARSAGAAFANATTANGLDCDDQDDLTLGHPGVMVFPTALALCEKYELGGREMLAAAAVGYEIALRAGRCWHWQHLPVYHADGSWGAVACAATAAHLMKLDEDQIRHALGIAEYYAPQVPMEHDLVNPAMVKHGHGWAAMTGIVSAELAERGFTGTPGLMGLEKFEDWVSTIGTQFLIVDEVCFKHFCGCGWAHMAVGAAQKLQREHDWHVEDIKTITVEGHRWTSLLSTAHPRTTEEAQFSVQWTLAAFLVDDALGPDQLLEPRLGDPEINELVDKIELIESDELTERYLPIFERRQDPNALETSRVVIQLEDGRVLDSGLEETEEPWGTEAELTATIEKKFRWLTSYVLEEDRAEALLDMLWRFDEVQNVRELTEFLKTR